MRSLIMDEGPPEMLLFETRVENQDRIAYYHSIDRLIDKIIYTMILLIL